MYAGSRITGHSLEQYPLKDYAEGYAEIGRKVTHLTLYYVREEDVELALSFYPHITSLTLMHVVLLGHGVDKYPTKLSILKLVDCKINKELMEKWFIAMAPTLIGLEIIRSFSVLALDFEGFGSVCSLFKELPSLLHLNIENDSFNFSAKLPSLVHFSYNGLQENSMSQVTDMLLRLGCEDTLETVVLPNRPKDVTVFNKFSKLRDLRIINPIDKVVKDQLTLLKNWRSLDIHCFECPAVEDLMLNLLNDDCIYHILSFLDVEDLASIRQTNTRFANLTAFPALKINDSFVAKYPLDEAPKNIYETIGQHTRKLTLVSKDWNRVLPYFDLQELSMSIDFNKTLADDQLVKLIPKRLKKLELVNSGRWKELPLQDLFTQLNATLKTLYLSNVQDTGENSCLTNVCNLKLKRLVNVDLQKMLENMVNLEQLEVDCNLLTPDNVILNPVKRLKSLKLTSLPGTIVLEPKDFPLLKHIRVSFNKKVSQSEVAATLEKILAYKHLQSLGFPVQDGKCDIQRLFILDQLEILDCSGQIVNESLLESCIMNLPKLTRVILWNGYLSINCEMELRKILTDQRRSIHLSSTGRGVFLEPNPQWRCH